MAESPFSRITSIPPRRLAIIAGGGIAAGLAWRYWQSRNGNSSSAESSVSTSATSDVIDTRGLGLDIYSSGNLSAVPTTGSDVVAPATRDLGMISLPAVSQVLNIAGKKYEWDGENLNPLNPAPEQSAPTPGVVNKPEAPAPDVWVKPSWLTSRFVIGENGGAVYEVTPTGLQWVPNEQTFFALGGGGTVRLASGPYTYGGNPGGIPPQPIPQALLESLLKG